MTQLTIDLDDETAQRLKDIAAQGHMRASEWVASMVRARVGGLWPDEVRQLAGAWPDLADGDVLRASTVSDIQREAW